MADQGIPSTMRAWQFSTAKGGLENTIRLTPSASVPATKANLNLIRVVAAAINPVDYKIVETPLIGGFTHPKPATPGLDVVGRIVKPAPGSPFKVGELVFGTSGTSNAAGGALAEYAVIDTKNAARVPEGVDAVLAGTVGIAGVTAYQSLVPFVKPGSRVFINGGSGGVGTYAIQIAKAVGCHVTTSCSTPNVSLCQSLGADEVIDYKKGSVLEQLKKQEPFDHVVDLVGGNYDLYWKMHDYTKPAAKYGFVGATPSFGFFSFMIKASLLPGFLGGAKRKLSLIFCVVNPDDLAAIGHWMAEGKVKAVVDSTYTFDKATDAIRRQKTSRARGKIVVEVAPEASKT